MSNPHNGNGESTMDDGPRPIRARFDSAAEDLTLTEREALRHYGTIAARYDHFVRHELPDLKADVDITRGAALAAAGHAEGALIGSKRVEIVAAEALACAKGAESAAKRAEDASKRTEAVVSNLANDLLAKARKVAAEVAEKTAEDVAGETGKNAAEDAMARAEMITKDDLEAEAIKAAQIVVQGEKLADATKRLDRVEKTEDRRVDALRSYLIGAALLATGGIGGAIWHWLASK